MGAEAVFITSLALIAYAYMGYPALIFILSRIFGREPHRADIEPAVSVIIAAFNEERDIVQKIENTLALDYPREKLEIIIASDCSTDGTDELVRRYQDRGVILHKQPARLGKTVAQNCAVRISTGEVLVFSDATTMYEPDAIRKIVRSFADPEVGCVAGQLSYVDRSRTAVGRGCRSYWGYEKFIKQSESRMGSLIGVSGCLYAVRRSSYAKLAGDMSSDFVIATEIHLLGLRTVYEAEAIATEDTNKRGRDEFRMRVRVIEQTMTALRRYREVLDIGRHGMFAFQMLSHKVLRYGVAPLMLVALASNIFLINSSDFYHLTFMGQVVSYSAALVGWICERVGLRLRLLGLPYYFVLANAAVLAALDKFFRG
ncbi:MAG TPA: glycosyltransferase family 2 protein, partial [Blastocatellia bacterium]|nr:glycosyltransferase family 2 protein [Blastocatellia bacterium]